jgi:enoyl-CoA hydratase
MQNVSLKIDTDGKVRSLILCRPEQYNTLTPELRDELSAALDDANADPEIRVVVLRSTGRAFCAGYGLGWTVERHLNDEAKDRAWDSVTDLRYYGSFVATFQKLWYGSKPTIAAVNGWCIGGGTDLVLWADLIIAGESASFGYPPSRVWGVPTSPMWIHRLGFERAKRYLFTGDEIPAPEAAKLGLILETVPDDALESHAMKLAHRIAQVPSNQLQMLKLFCNQSAENMGLASARLLATLFDGVARHTQEGLDFVTKAQDIGFREAVRERDRPFGDYGEGPRARKKSDKER